MQFRLPTLLCVILCVALGLAAYARYRAWRTPWEKVGGMIGWSQAAIETSLGPPTQVFEGDVSDENALRIRLRPAGTIRTLSYRTFDGQFVVRLNLEGDGQFRCFGSWWVEKHRYY